MAGRSLLSTPNTEETIVIYGDKQRGGPMSVSAAFHLAVLNTCPEPVGFDADGYDELFNPHQPFLKAACTVVPSPVSARTG